MRLACNKRWPIGKALAGLTWIALAVSTTEAQLLRFGQSRECPPCPAVPAPAPAPAKEIPPAATPPTALPSDALDLEPVSRAGIGDMVSMFGDQFGGTGKSRVRIDRLWAIPRFTDSDGWSRKEPPLTYFDQTVRVRVTDTNIPVQSRVAANAALAVSNTLTTVDVANGEVVTTLPSFAVASKLPPDSTLPIVNNSAYQQIVNGVFASRNSLPGTSEFVAASSAYVADVMQLTPAGSRGSGVYNYDYILAVNIPNPSKGGTVGRAKVSEDNNPLPRDRFIFNYDYFDDTQLTARGWNVHRYVVGFEKTFFDRWTSFEVRFPFAGTLNRDIRLGAETGNTEVGNIGVTGRALFWRGETLNVAGGLRVDLPTAESTQVFLPNGTELVRINNRAVILIPFVAAMWTPTDRIFFQSWAAADFDANGNPVEINTTGAGLVTAGRLNDAPFVQWDGQIGYWLYRPDEPGRLLGGFAPFLELHYGTTVQNADFVQSNGFVVGDLANRIDALNLSTGALFQIGANGLLSLGVVVPLRNDDDRGFDYQIGVRFNMLLGPTAQSRGGRLSTF